MKIKILINLIILLSWACHGPSDEKSSYPPGSYIPEIDNSLAGSIIVDEYLIKNGYALHDGREVINVTSATSDIMLGIDKKGDDAIIISATIHWNDTIVNIFSDNIQISGNPGYVTFENIRVNANIRLNDKYETSTITVNGYIKNITYSRLTFDSPEFECKINIQSEFDGKLIEVQFNAIEPNN